MPEEPKTTDPLSAPGAPPAKCEESYSAIYERRIKARRAKTMRTAATITSAVIAVGSVVAGIAGGVATAVKHARKKK